MGGGNDCMYTTVRIHLFMVQMHTAVCDSDFFPKLYYFNNFWKIKK